MLKRLFLSLIWCGLAAMPQVYAQQGDVAGSADPAIPERFPGSDIVDYRDSPSTNYQLVLGRMQRVNGRVTPGRAERVTGHLTRVTYRIPPGFSAEEVFDYFRDQLLQGADTALFVCQGRGCGSSNFWANDVFNNRILYGPEANQYYLAANPDTGEGRNAYVAVYVVARASRSVYAHIDVLELPSGETLSLQTSPVALLQQLRREQSVVLPGIVFDDQDEMTENSGISLAADALRREPLLDVYIVGHLNREGQDLDSLQDRSSKRADRVRQALIEAGVRSDRIIAAGVGPLAPTCSAGECQQRIELVLRQ